MRPKLRRRWPLLVGLAGFAVGLVLLALPRLDGSSADADCAGRPTATAEVANPEGHSVGADIEDLTQELYPTLRERWAGGWVNDDGSVTIGIVGDEPVPPEAKRLTEHPLVTVVERRCTTTRLQNVQLDVIDRLDRLAPADAGATSGRDWYDAGISNQANAVEVTVVERYRRLCHALEAEFAAELAEGTLRIDYGEDDTVLPPAQPLPETVAIAASPPSSPQRRATSSFCSTRPRESPPQAHSSCPRTGT